MLNNYRCSKKDCSVKFYLDPKATNRRCPECGYRILDKLRTKNYITYSTD